MEAFIELPDSTNGVSQIPCSLNRRAQVAAGAEIEAYVKFDGGLAPGRWGVRRYFSPPASAVGCTQHGAPGKKPSHHSLSPTLLPLLAPFLRIAPTAQSQITSLDW